jgi:DinB superfamily
MRRRPSTQEHDPYYASYVAAVPEGEISEILEREGRRAVALFESIPVEKGTYRYLPDKWSICEVLGHIVDTERIMSFRALWIARADLSPLPGMDQDFFVEGADFDGRGIVSITDEFRALRTANIELCRSFSGNVPDRRGFASGLEFTVRALVYIMAGHAIHHVRVLEDRYL